MTDEKGTHGAGADLPPDDGSQGARAGISRRAVLRGSAALSIGGSLGLSAAGTGAAGTDTAAPATERGQHYPYPPYPSAELNDAAYGRFVAVEHARMMSAGGPMSALNIQYGRRENARVQDAYTGEWYWDCHRNGTKYHLGHRHPEVVATLSEALQHIDAGNFLVLSGYRAKLGELLAATTNGDLPHVTFGVGGTDAIECAIHAARNFHHANGENRRKLVAIRNVSYHGGSDLTLSISGAYHEQVKRYLVSTADVTAVPFNDLAAMKAAITRETAAVVIEPSPAQGGFPPPSKGYLEGVKAACEAKGALMIVDDVQTGLGVLGTTWSYQSFDFKPDMVVTGKGLGAGLYPISVALMTTPVWQTFTSGQLFPHPSTYAGSDLGCVVGYKVMQITSDPAYLGHVRKLSEQFARGFADLPVKLNQLGLCMGIPSANPLETVARLLKNRILVIPSDVAPVIPFRPIPTLSETEADTVIGLVRDALS
jgi:acetylornithine/succinyldiaminopimelate/putrescine aminotransferase